MTEQNNTNDTYIFRVINDPSTKALLVSTAEEDGVQIKHSDFFYKNEISVAVDGKTHTVTTPNFSFILAVLLLLIIWVTNIFKKIREIIELKSLINKYPLVSAEYLKKSGYEQSVENNQEIQELNVRLENYEDNIHSLKGKVDKILQKLDDKIDELEK